MLTLHVDLGQIIIGALIALVGFLLKREVNSIGSRLDKHEQVLFAVNGDLSKAIGQIGVLFHLLGVERRKELDK